MRIFPWVCCQATEPAVLRDRCYKGFTSRKQPALKPEKIKGIFIDYNNSETNFTLLSGLPSQ